MHYSVSAQPNPQKLVFKLQARTKLRIRIDQTKAKLSKPLDAYQFPKENQDPPASFEIPDIHQLLSCIDPLGPEEQISSNLRKSSLNLNQPESPSIFSFIQDLDLTQNPSDQIRKKKCSCRAYPGCSQSQNPAKEPREPIRGRMPLASDSTSVNKDKRSGNKPHKAASSRSSTTKRHGQEKTKRAERTAPRNLKRLSSQGPKSKVEEKQAIPHMSVRKINLS
ncbi:hypothetical protein AAY473_040436 [Plecturocebus cupreus]